ncbi:type III-A CRISPR-associated RAMP protein Csm5 [Fulvitalea axinellae]
MSESLIADVGRETQTARDTGAGGGSYQERVNKTYALRLTTLTPVCVKSHEEPLSPLADYVVDGCRLRILDRKRFFDFLSEGDRLEKYQELVESVRPQAEGKAEEFYEFLINNSAQLDSMTKSIREFSIPDNLVQIGRHIHSGDQVYLPGSTLKGAVRNALFNSFYSNQSNRNRIKETSKKKKMEVHSPEFIRDSENYSQGQKKGFLSTNASLWGFRDSAFIDQSQLKVIQLNRRRLRPVKEEKDLNGLSVLQEAIKAYSPLYTELTFKVNKLDDRAKEKRVNSYNNIKLKLSCFFSALNRFVIQFIDFQIAHIQVSDLGKYQEQLTRYGHLAKKFQEEGDKRALICLGFGKTQLQNTIGLSVPEDARKRHKYKDPATLFLDTNGEAIGWCVIEEATCDTLNYAEMLESICVDTVDTGTAENMISPSDENKEELVADEGIDLSELHRGAVLNLTVQAFNPRKKPLRIIVKTVQYGKEVLMEVTGVKKGSRYQQGDVIRVSLGARKQTEGALFKQGKLVDS